MDAHASDLKKGKALLQKAVRCQDWPCLDVSPLTLSCLNHQVMSAVSNISFLFSDDAVKKLHTGQLIGFKLKRKQCGGDLDSESYYNR